MKFLAEQGSGWQWSSKASEQLCLSLYSSPNKEGRSVRARTQVRRVWEHIRLELPEHTRVSVVYTWTIIVASKRHDEWTQ